MNTSFKPRQQQGSVLLIALMLLIALTLLTLSNMRGVSLESRITANRVEASRLQNLADAALREGEFRFYGPGNIREKLEAKLSNCSRSNQLNRNGLNKPCLLTEMTDDNLLKEFFSKPISFFKEDNDYTDKFNKKTGAETDTAGDSDILAWMPYRGLDSKSEFYFIADKENSYWNSYRVMSGSEENESLNPHSGDALEGKGVYFYLVTAQSSDKLAAQSTLAVTFLGLNN
ncbi:MAG: PilX N-terminal domain-containing pilus assembly protein [Thiopseudomonas sp.]